MSTPDHSPLGKATVYADRYDPKLLFPIPRSAKRAEIGVGMPLPFHGTDLWNAYELSWLDLHGKPQVALASSKLEANGSISVVTVSSAAVVTTLAYDALGNLTQRTEATGRPEQRTTRYEYDALGRQVRVIHPPISIYDAAADALATNGASGVAVRVETPSKSLEARTWYDALGNAVASIDVGGALSQKAYDLAGRVAYEIDALGYVTGYTRNAFGEATQLVRYASKTSLADRAVTQAAQAATREQVQAALAGVSHAGDRKLITSYDRAGRVIRSEAPSVYVYDSGAAAGSQTGAAATGDHSNPAASGVSTSAAAEAASIVFFMPFRRTSILFSMIVSILWLRLAPAIPAAQASGDCT